MNVKVRLTQSLATSHKHSYLAGTIIDVDAGEASRLIAGGMAEAVQETKEAKAVKPAANRMLKPPTNRTKQGT